jgi:hypothetical protein
MSHETTKDEDAWTVVVKSKKAPNQRQQKTTGTAKKGAPRKSKLQHTIAAAKAKQEALLGGCKADESNLSKEERGLTPDLERKRIIDLLISLQCCVEGLWEFGAQTVFREFFVKCVGLKGKHGHTLGGVASDGSAQQIKQIACYGIGNFSKAYSPPMIQLACAIILRRIFSVDSDSHDQCLELNWEKREAGISMDLTINGSKKQQAVSMSFFDPCTTPLEACVLREHLDIEVIDNNTQGRHLVGRDNKTILFMPHCPMQLYSNVLWVNWDEEHLVDGNVILLGNSLKGYDDAIFDSRKRNDDANGIFRIIPHVHDTPLRFPKKRAHASLKYQKVADGLQGAFNDCR